MITKPVILWIGASPQVVVPVSQYDTIWNFVFSVRYEDAEWTIPAGATAKLMGRTSASTTFEIDGTISDNKITVTASTSVTGVAGNSVCEVRIIADGKQVSTANFILAVEKAP